VFSWNFPAGLVLYFATSNLFRIGQQATIFALDDRHAAAKARPATSSPAIDPATDPASDPGPPRAPAPNISKKRKQRRRK
jgi:membrane protein insertase Oxa1/YidC/SpoIIIJ